MSFAGRAILTTEDLNKEDILEILKVTAKMEAAVHKERGTLEGLKVDLLCT
jgi:aspartate carbamoyltransferase catalytic subunit